MTDTSGAQKTPPARTADADTLLRGIEKALALYDQGEVLKWLLFCDRNFCEHLDEAPSNARLILAHIAALKAENERLTRERDEARDYAFEATKAITGLHGGGSECFAGKLGDQYKADLAFCVQRIWERSQAAHERLVDAVTSKKGLAAELAALKAKLAEAEAASERLLTAVMATDAARAMLKPQHGLSGISANGVHIVGDSESIGKVQGALRTASKLRDVLTILLDAGVIDAKRWPGTASDLRIYLSQEAEHDQPR